MAQIGKNGRRRAPCLLCDGAVGLSGFCVGAELLPGKAGTEQGKCEGSALPPPDRMTQVSSVPPPVGYSPLLPGYFIAKINGETVGEQVSHR
jgi:hypothetical protein